MPALRTRDGRKLAWQEKGSGPPLVCHPGGPGGSALYFGELPELAAERTLLLLDPRGTGASDRPADPRAYDLADYVADVEAIREELGLERLDLLGHSHGGFVAMTWAAAHPEHVGHLVLSNTAPRFTDVVRRTRQEIVDSYADEPWFADALDALDAHQSGRYGDDAELAAVLERELPFYFPRWGDEEQAFALRLRDSGLNADALRHFNDAVAPGMDLRPGLARVTAPALVITGELDFFPEATARELAGALPNASVVVLPGAGHFVFGEPANAPAWSRAILDFLSGD
jgi:pimeloyl-ACP methyl ester carboxylesterase